MKVSDRLFGVVFILLGGLVALYGASLPKMVGQPFGSGMFPLVIGCCLALGGAVLALEGWQRRSSEPLLALADWGRSRPHLINLALTIGCILAFALLIRQIGFAVLTFATIALLLWRFGQPIWRALLVAVIAAASFQFLFVSLMRVPLPPGILLGLIY